MNKESPEYKRVRDEVVVLVRGEAGDIAYGYSEVTQADFTNSFLLPLAQKILSIKGIEIQADLQEPPTKGYSADVEQMLKAGFVKVIQ